MGLVFKIGQAVPEIFHFLYYKKERILGTILGEKTYIKWHQNTNIFAVACMILRVKHQ